MPQLTNLDVEWVSLVDRAAVRDPIEQSEPNRFLLWKRDRPVSKGDKPMPLTPELLDQLGDAVAKEADLAALVEKNKDAGRALQGAARLLSAHKGDLLTPEIVAEVVKAAGLELPEGGTPGADAKTASELVEALKGTDVSEDVIKEVEGALKKAAEKAEIDKADLPESVRKALAKAEDDRAEATRKADEAQRMAKEERDTRLSKEFVAKAESDYGNLSLKAEEFGPVLKEASEKLSKEAFKALEGVLKASDEQIAKGELFKEAGSGGGTPAADSAYAEAQRKAEDIRKADPELTKEQALAKAFADPEIEARHLAEVR